MIRAAFVYPNPRWALLEEIAAGRAPDTGLLGQNHLAGFGIEATIHHPGFRRRERAGGVLHRLTWNLRELTLPWELGRADVAVTPLANLFPLAARLRRHPRVVLLNISLCTAWERGTAARRRALAASVRSAAAVVCFAGTQRERLIAQTGADPARIHAVLLGVDADFYTPRPPPESGYVLAVGRDLARDYATFGAALEGLPARAIVVASERNLTGVRLPPNVETRLDVSYEELRDLYAGAACVVIPARRAEYRYGADCSGQTVLLDATAMGRPVVVTERGTLAEYVHPGETAIPVPPEDPQALRAAVETVLGDPEAAERIGAAARQLVEERHTTRLLAERLAGILRSVDAA